jgi:hypothetical protein
MQFLSDDRVKQLKGMSYVEAWDVKATLTRVFGFGGFSTQILNGSLIHKEQVPQSRDASKMNWSVAYECTMRLIVPQLGAYWDETAVGSSAQPVIGEALDMATKSASSDALKRCATMLGTQFGLGLYDDGNQMEIIRRIVAPGQEWDISKGGRVIPGQKREEPQPEERPATAGAATVRPYNTTEAEHSQNVDLLNQALSAKKKQQEHRGGFDVPVALDPSIDTAPDRRGLIDGDPDADLHNPMDASGGIPAR